MTHEERIAELSARADAGLPMYDELFQYESVRLHRAHADQRTGTIHKRDCYGHKRWRPKHAADSL